MNKQIIILLGPPGAGKGTQAQLLSGRMDLYYLETSKLIENKIMNAEKRDIVEINGKKYPLLKEKELWENGKLCSPPFAAWLIKNRVERLSQQEESLVIAGSPRTVYEGNQLTPFLKELYGESNIKVILIELSPEQSIFRNSHRRICELMRHPILYNEETKILTKCPLDGSSLQKREKLDDPETIKERIKEYKNRTFPLIDYLKKQGLLVEKVDGDQSVAGVFEDIMKVLK